MKSISFDGSRRKWFRTTKEIQKPKAIEPMMLAKSDLANTESYLIRHLKDYVSWNENDPEHIAQVCRIVDALSKLKGLV
jgi:hypothetical protein